jgi:colanic acid/amylovoran biosynthesis glycosyltransferase
MRVAYFTSTFARPSDTFIRTEVNELRQLGAEVQTYSIRRPLIESRDDADVHHHQQNTTYLLEAGLGRLARDAINMLIRSPRRVASAASLAWRTSPPGLRGLLRQSAYFVEALSLARQLMAARVELLHNHIGENSATVAMLASIASAIPYSLTIHGPGVFFAPNYWALGEKIDRAAATVAISDFCRSQCCVVSKPQSWDRIHVVRCSLQREFLAEASTGDGGGRPLFVCVGRLCHEKAQRILLGAAAKLARDGKAFEIVLVGDGPDRSELEELVVASGLTSHVTFAGWQTSAQIRHWLTRARAFVLPSFAEGLPVVLMEAMALGRPIVATRIAAIPELVVDGEHGWIVAPSSIAQLADAMHQVLDSTAGARATMGELARDAVLAAHHPEEQARKLLALFETITGASKNDRSDQASQEAPNGRACRQPQESVTPPV